MGVEPIFPAWKADELTDIRTEQGDNRIFKVSAITISTFLRL